MNASEGFVFPKKEKNFGNGNGCKTEHVMKNNNRLGVSRSGKNNNICGKSAEAHMRNESLPKKTRRSPDDQEEDLGSSFEGPSPLGLKLAKTQSLITELENMKSAKEKKLRLDNEGTSHAKPKGKSDEFKAANFSALHIKIGNWQRMARYEGDLVVKLYYCKRKLVWEVLEGPLKSKMEIQWSDICGIRAITPENAPGLLEIELIQPPMFFRETCPQPRKHTLWQQSSDFTGGQAPIWRRHQVTFPAGVLERNYEKLLQCDKELKDLSKKSFPTHESGYFDPTFFGNTLNFGGYGANRAAQYEYQAYPPILPRATPSPSLSGLDLPFTYQGGNCNFVAQNQASWQQDFGINTNLNNVYYPPFPSTTNDNNVYYPQYPSTTNDNVYYPPYPSTTNNNVYDPSFSSTTNGNNVFDPLFLPTTNDNNAYNPSCYDPNASGLQTSIQTDLLDGVQLDDALLETVGSISSLLEPTSTVNNINGSSYQPDIAFHSITEDQGNNNYDFNGMVPDPIHWLAIPGSSENVIQGSSADVFEGSSANVFRGANDNMFQSTNDNMFQGANGNVFQGANQNMFQGASENMFDQLAGNNRIDIGAGGFINLFPY